MPKPALLTTAELCAASGATKRQVQVWSEYGLLKCSMVKMSGRGRGHVRGFHEREVLCARVAATLWKRRVGSIARRRALTMLAQNLKLDPPFWLIVEGRDVHLTRVKRDVIEIALGATRGVVVVEVAA
jgi:hypothetical protein